MTDFNKMAAEARGWLLNSAIPLWLERGVDWKGYGYHESLSLDTVECSTAFKRLRVTTRQIYVFAAATRMGVTDARAALDHGLDFLLDKARHPDGGFASRFDLAGNIIDPTRDLYDLAFCLFAFAHAYSIRRDQALRDEARKLATFIATRMHHPHGGFHEALPISNNRRQNPHMHLLEAALEWRRLDDAAIFRDLCDEIIALFEQRFFSAPHGALIEHFDDTLVPAAGDLGRITEPGHHFEWIWLLDRYETEDSRRDQTRDLLYQFAITHGLDGSSGRLYGEVLTDGVVQTREARVWPHTEWLKAELVLPYDDKVERVSKAWRALRAFLASPVEGLWHERWLPHEGRFSHEPAPASSLYHLTLAIECFAEVAERDGVKCSD
ncbi:MULTISPECIES: AGE family epimerase/isomerase [unclassified Beijerinckia]|uniref:AGE family epimerase/isomerase n=1 Tax=unclassified Beijerinckia TaxID=2638183 RepID=UPI000894AE3E|nr:MULTISPECIES: AGE family epimerase/isomerase [unclassified Beijerinckia]MDH7797809.1 mannose/cellobiose epimerase-like protein (N-acyl-D-glucosamine 2-epimerase family) [Beijerinckia sp. GAS462]SEC99301.1 mannose-6-phosphate isomerase, type 3 [Beijerinckia sp. 28-YEA-48]